MYKGGNPNIKIEILSDLWNDFKCFELSYVLYTILFRFDAFSNKN